MVEVSAAASVVAGGRAADGARSSRARSRLRGWGGVRAGAGRKRATGRPNVPHRRREEHRGERPVLVTLRTRCRVLRSQFVFPTVRWAIAATNAKRAYAKQSRAGEFFRICEFSVQGDHVHLLVEASCQLALERGVRGLAIRLAKSVNQLLFQKGKFLDDRYHALELGTARSVRNALVYVLANFRKHGRGRSGEPMDAYSSAPYFLGFAEFAGAEAERLCARFVPRALAPPRRSPVERPRTRLLAESWRQFGRISVWEGPKGAPRTGP